MMSKDRRLRRFAVSYTAYPEDNPVYNAHGGTTVIEIADGSFVAMLMDLREALADFANGERDAVVFREITEVFDDELI